MKKEQINIRDPFVVFEDGKYYMFATFTQDNGLIGTYSLISEDLKGPFVPLSKGTLTPYKWECLDGTFIFRSKTNELFMIWSSFIDGNYAEMAVRFKNGRLGNGYEHLKPLLDSDGGHGMIFTDTKNSYFTYHTPNTSGMEHPEFCIFIDDGDNVSIEI